MRDVSKEQKAVVNGTAERDEPDTLTIEETAKRLRIGLNSAYAGVKSGAIPVIRIGRRLLVPRAALEALLAAGEPIERTGPSSRPVGYPSGGLGQFVDRIRRSTPVESASSNRGEGDNSASLEALESRGPRSEPS
jgi:excisionase family DNA binding protein